MPKHEPTKLVPEGPQPIVFNPGDCAPYPVDSLGPLEEVVRVVEDRTQAPIALAAQSALGVASLISQAFVNVETLAGNFSPASLYLLSIARSGERKSAADAFFLEPIQSFEKELQGLHAQEMLEWEAAHRRWESEREGLLNGLNIEEGRPLLLDPEPLQPMSPDRTVEEPTLEGLYRKYLAGHPSLALFSDEGGQFLGGHAMNSDNRQKTSAALNGLWNGKPIKRTRQGDGHFTLYGRRLSVHLMVQPSVFTGLVADPLIKDIGLLPRFLCVWPRSLMGSRLYKEPDLAPGPLEAYSALVRERLSLDPEMDEHTRDLQPRNLQYSAAGKSLLVDFFNEVEAKLAPHGEYFDLTGEASKAAEQAARIAAVLAHFEAPDVAFLPVHCIERGIILGRYYLNEAKRISEVAPLDHLHEGAIRVSAYLRDKQVKEFALERLTQKGPLAWRPAPVAKRVMKILEEFGHVERLPEGSLVDGKNRKLAWKSLV